MTENISRLTKGQSSAAASMCLCTLVWGWSGDAMALGKFPVPGRPTIWMTVGQGPIVLALGAGWGLFGLIYSRLSFLSYFSLSLGDGPI